jgi:hypothetical protein
MARDYSAMQAPIWSASQCVSVCLAVLLMNWFRVFLTELSTDREYQQTFDRSLALLGGGLPEDLLRFWNGAHA